MAEVSIETFVSHVKGPLGLEVCAGQSGMDRMLKVPRIQKPGLALTGYSAFIHPDRIQVMGQTELTFLATLSPADISRVWLTSWSCSR